MQLGGHNHIIWDVRNSGKVIYHGWEFWGFGVTLLLQPTQWVIWRNQSFCSSIYQSVSWECSQSETQELNTDNRTQLHIVSATTVISCFRRVQLFATPWTIDCQAPQSMGFSRHEYWIGVARGSSSGDLPDPGIEFALLTSLALTGGFFITSTTWETPSITTSTFRIIVIKFQVSSE